MTDETKKIAEAYFSGRLHESLLQIRNDLHMDDRKNALIKVNDSIKLIEDKIIGIMNHIKEESKD